MANVKETTLPGVGVRHEFITKSGDHVGTITHRSGRRDLLIFSQKDPDACARAIRLDDDDADTLADLLGSESDVQREQDNVRGEIGGLTLDWLPIAENWKCSGISIDDTHIYRETAVVIVAVMRHGEPIPTPNGNFRLRAGDVASVVGAPDGIERAQDLLQKGFCG
jgi:TrkA domain protein